MKAMRVTNIFGFIVLWASAVSANALIVTDEKEWIPDYYGDEYLYLSYGDSKTYTHDLSDDGVPTDYLVESASLQLWLVDDKQFFGDGRYESEQAVVATVDFTTSAFEVDGGYTWGWQLDPQVMDYGLGLAGIASLNEDGMFNVTVESVYGDFFLKKSTLTANVNPVPLPGSMLLFGAGLLGFGVLRRRKAR